MKISTIRRTLFAITAVVIAWMYFNRDAHGQQIRVEMRAPGDRLHAQIIRGYYDEKGHFFISDSVPKGKTAAVNITVTNMSGGMSKDTLLYLFRSTTQTSGRKLLYLTYVRPLLPKESVEEVVKLGESEPGILPLRLRVGEEGLAEAALEIR